MGRRDGDPERRAGGALCRGARARPRGTPAGGLDRGELRGAHDRDGGRADPRRMHRARAGEDRARRARRRRVVHLLCRERRARPAAAHRALHRGPHPCRARPQPSERLRAGVHGAPARGRRLHRLDRRSRGALPVPALVPVFQEISAAPEAFGPGRADQAQAPGGHPGAWGSKSRWSGGEVTPFERMRVLNPPPSELVRRRLAERLPRRAPWLGEAGIAEIWAGMIDVTPDAVPYICEAPAPDGLFIGTGMSGHGFGIGPGVGRVLADLVLGRPPGHDLARFRFGASPTGVPSSPGRTESGAREAGFFCAPSASFDPALKEGSKRCGKIWPGSSIACRLRVGRGAASRVLRTVRVLHRRRRRAPHAAGRGAVGDRGTHAEYSRAGFARVTDDGSRATVHQAGREPSRHDSLRRLRDAGTPARRGVPRPRGRERERLRGLAEGGRDKERDMPHSTYLPERMGSAAIDPRGRFEAGSFQSSP